MFLLKGIVTDTGSGPDFWGAAVVMFDFWRWSARLNLMCSFCNDS